MIKWKLYEDYENQKHRFDDFKEKYIKNEASASKRVTDLTSQLESLIKQELSGCEDLSTDKKKLRKQIEEAEKEYEAATKERQHAFNYVCEQESIDKISIRDLVLDFRDNYRHKVREEELSPVIERMLRGKEEFYNAIVDYQELRAKYSEIESEIKNLCYKDNDNYPGAHISLGELFSLSDLPIVTDREVYNLQKNGEWPKGTSRVIAEK
ncbi:hypothetical protein [Marinicrinis sediminis]|uniref:Uncharacterized protein n=1 Tax=Marinicrinis sediminis TaxID=1652465 RepID=A0ABW5RCL5_9BACL